MNDSGEANDDRLANVETLIRTGSYEEALCAIDRLEEITDLASSDQLTYQLLRGNILNKLGRFEEARVLADYFLLDNQSLGDHIQMVDALIVKASALWRLGMFDESLGIIEQGEKVLKNMASDESVEITRRQGFLFSRKGTIYQDKGELDRALDYYERSLKVFKRDEYKENIAEALNNIGTIYDERGNHIKALEYYQQSLALREEIGNGQDIAKCLNNIGIVHWMQGDFDQSIEYTEQSLEIFKENGNTQNVALTLSNLGAVLQSKGNLKRALECYRQSLVIFEEIGNKQHIALVLSNLGVVHSIIGNLDQALEHYQKGLALFEEIGNKSDIALSLNNIGSVLWQKGADFEQSLEYLERSLALREEVGNNLDIADALYSLIYIANDRGFSEKARWYLERLLRINNVEDNKLVRQMYRVAQALMLKKSIQKRDTDKAKLLLRQVIEDEVLEHEIFTEAMLNLCDSLLVDLSASGEQKVLKDVRFLVSKLLAVVNEQRSHALLVETYLLQSKLALLELNLKEAQRLLTKAQFLADRNGMVRLALKISREHDSLLMKLKMWERFSEKGASLKELTDSVGLREIVISMIRKRTITDFETPEEEPVFLSIIRPTDGLIIFSNNFLPENEIDEDLQNTFRDAIKLAIEDYSSFSIDLARLEEYTLLVRSEASVLACYVFKGQSYSAQQKMTKFLKSISSILSVWESLTDAVDQDGILREFDKTLIEGILTEIF